VIYTSQGRTGEAIALLQAACQAAPSYAEAWNNLGVAQRDIGAVADAIASYERAATLAPEQVNAGMHTGDEARPVGAPMTSLQGGPGPRQQDAFMHAQPSVNVPPFNLAPSPLALHRSPEPAARAQLHPPW
jgi:tetratricopeptide (TPR) repeat protein